MKTKKEKMPSQIETIFPEPWEGGVASVASEFPELDEWFRLQLEGIEPEEEQLPDRVAMLRQMQARLEAESQYKKNETSEEVVSWAPVGWEAHHRPNACTLQKTSSTSLLETSPRTRKEKGREPDKKVWWSWLRTWRWEGTFAAVAACGLLLWSSWGSGVLSPVQEVPLVRRSPGGYVGKGNALWSMLYARPSKQTHRYTLTTRAKQGQELAAGDLIQLAYQLPRSQYVMVIHVDAKGVVASGVPLGGTQSLFLQAGQGTLPKASSMELDESLGWERLFVVSSTQPFGLKEVQVAFRKAWLHHQGNIQKVKALEGKWEVRSFLFRKVVRR